MSAPPPLDERRIAHEFPFAREVSYLNTAAEGLLPRSGRDALLSYADDKARGERGREAMYATEDRLRARVAERLAARADQVTFLPSAARGVGAVLGAIDWRPGDNVVTGDAEFPTNVLGPLSLAGRGIETRIVPSPGGRYAEAALERLVDRRTRLVIVSAVSFRTGFRADLGRVADVAHASGAPLLVDATQAFGVVPVTLAPADALVASTFKWALGVHGAAVFAIADSLAPLAPATAGWRGVQDLFAADRFERVQLRDDARRFDEGMPSYGSHYVLEATLDLLDRIGAVAIERHVASLVQHVVLGLDALGIPSLASADPARRAGIVAFETEQPESLAADLARRDILVWGRDRRLRVSPHLYTTVADIDRFLASLADRRTGTPARSVVA